MIGVLTKRGNLDTETLTTQGENSYVTSYAFISQIMPETRRGKEESSPTTFRESITLLTPCFWTSRFQNGENKFLLFSATQFVALCTAALEN